jgi:hypothetical protein
MKSPIALLRCLLFDFKRLHPGVKGLERDFETLKLRVEHEGYGFLTVALPALDEALLKGLDEERFTCPIGFKKIRGGSIPVFLQGMIGEIFDSVTGTLKGGSERAYLRDVHTFLLTFKKVRLTAEGEELLHQKAVKGFYQCDETASSVVIPDRQDHLIGLVGRTILLSLHRKDSEDERYYRHGPGAVQEGCSPNQKWSGLLIQLEKAETPDWFGTTNFFDGIRHAGRLLNMGYTGRPDGVEEGALRLLPNTLQARRSYSEVPVKRLQGTDRFRAPTTWGACQAPPRLECDDCLSASHDGDGQRSQLRRLAVGRGRSRPRGASAKLISVLKNTTSRRTITIEPLLRMYLQQGLNSMLRESITECRVLRNCLALTDQSENQKLAMEGSSTRKWATIDLKSASDLLSVKLVESVFRHHPQFLGMMMDARSPYVYTSGTQEPAVPMGKFAGMGNATTFPVQSVCFAVICIAAILDTWGLKPTYKRVLRASRLVRVYGDDIIVHTDYAHRVVGWLHDVGLMVNVKKSFLKGNFRESCGVEAYRGVNITPLYIRHWPHHIDESPSVCAHLVSASNHYWLQGLYEASNYLRETVEGYLGVTLPLVSSQSGSLGWHSRQEAVEPHKWDRGTHQFKTRTFALKPVKTSDELDGDAALLKCLSSMASATGEDGKTSLKWRLRHLIAPGTGSDKDHLRKTVKRFNVRLIRRWVPSLTSEGLNLQV